MKQLTFETTSLTGRSGDPVGRDHGNGGVALASSEASAVRAWLVAQASPRQVDAALTAWVSISLGAEVSLRSELRFPEGRPAYRVTVGAHIGVKSADDAAKALAKFRTALTPATKEQSENWFYALWLASAGRQRSEMDAAATMAVYAATLGKYPADVCKAVFEHFTTAPSQGTNWFPTLAEMVSEADRLVSLRLSVIAALTNWKPEDDTSRKAVRVRSLMFEAAEVEDRALLLRRSDPPQYAQLIIRARALRSEASALKRGEMA